MKTRVTGPESPWTWANLATAVRLIGCTVIFGIAFHTGDERWNFAGLVAYWLLDMLDGALARWLDQETQLGAQFDILADRLLVALFYFVYVTHHPGMLVAVLLFLFQFMAIDHYLSNQYVRWRLTSPNYFHLVDRRIWALNWSAAGKLLNSAVVTLVLVGTHSVILGSAVAIAIIGLKAYSCMLLLRLRQPEHADQDAEA